MSNSSQGVTALIFSKDRPCQLHLLLESLHKNMGDTFRHVEILYRASNEEFLKGYLQCEAYWSLLSNVMFDFQNQDVPMHNTAETRPTVFDNWVYNKINWSDDTHIGIFTDDTVIYQPSPLVGTSFMDKLGIDNAVFSLRLGFNTIVQNCHTGELQYPLNLFVDEGETISWNFNNYHPLANYGYPFGLDGHIFKKDILEPIVKNLDRFNTTNELESKLCYCRNQIPSIMRSFKRSVAVNIPCNVHSGVTRAGELHPYSVEELNQIYLDKNCIDLAKLGEAEIEGCHQEVPFQFVRIQM